MNVSQYRKVIGEAKAVRIGEYGYGLLIGGVVHQLDGANQYVVDEIEKRLTFAAKAGYDDE